MLELTLGSGPSIIVGGRQLPAKGGTKIGGLFMAKFLCIRALYLTSHRQDAN
jgi:hypothetical protein